MKLLTENIRSHIEKAGGTWGVSLSDLHTHETWHYNPNLRFTAASVIKLPIMAAAYQSFEDRQFTFSDVMELKREEQVGGSGVLQHMTPGTKLTIYDVMVLMIIQSDNTATNMMIDLIGMEQIQATMEAAGLRDSVITNKLMIVSSARTGPNLATAGDMTKLLSDMARGKVVSEYACREMIAILKHQQINDCLPAKLPDPDSALVGIHPSWTLAHKTGNVTNVTHDVGVFFVGEHALAVSVLSTDIPNQQARETLSGVGAAIYEFLKR